MGTSGFGEVGVDFLRSGGGGGGIALRSSSCFDLPPSFTIGIDLDCTASSPLLIKFLSSAALISDSSIGGASARGVLGSKTVEGRRSHFVINQDDGGHW